jgi:very-short-patch-repair endonuclease
MMSPLSIATFLEQGGTDFDQVIFDEASQVRPVDAFGAILRGKQTIVVGDEKQLPPTSFFDAMTSDAVDGDDEGEEPLSAGIQSVLELFLAKDAPRESLLWHYRSRHHSLIALSNAEFYDNGLMVFPHAEQQRDDLGLVYHYLPDAVYGRGHSQRNPVEAREVAEAVFDHARENPGQTLGVAAFSTSQMQAILDELEAMRRLQPEYEGFFTAHPEEPFFVKNLENVQGDERDVIFISVGYGRDAAGNVSMNFGPLNWQGGERRLNVLITRARMRCEVFTNLTANDIDLTRTSARGVQALKHFLLYAETSVLDETIVGPPPTESPFEAAVRDVLEAAGHQVDTQVGVARYRVDLAIVDEHDPGRYLLGIECDGAMYHHARSARDRDRLRQMVLEQRGWHLYRIWSTDWFKHPAREAERLLAAVDAAKSTPRDVVSRRLADAAHQSLGARASARIESACAAATTSGRVKRMGDFMWLPGLSVAPVRDRSKLDSAERSWDKVSDFELCSAIQQAALASFGLEPADVPRAVGQLVGFGRTTASAEERVNSLVRNMIAKGTLVERGTKSLLKERAEKVTAAAEAQDVDMAPSAQPAPSYRLAPPQAASQPLALQTAGKPYLHARPAVTRLTGQLWEAPAAQLAPVMIAVCKVESPIHVNELNHRVANAFGRKKVGGRTRETLAAARRLAVNDGAVVVRGDFVWLPRQGPDVAIRDRTNIEAADKRIATVALEEIAMTVLACLNSGLASSQEELNVTAARILGFMRTGKDVADRIVAAVEAMLKAGVLARVGVDFRRVGPPAFLGPHPDATSGIAKSQPDADTADGVPVMAQSAISRETASFAVATAATRGEAPLPASDEVGEAISRLRDKHVRRKAMDRLRHLGGKAVPALVAALHDPSVRLFAIVSLAEIGAPAVEPLLKLLRDRDPVIAEAAQEALDRMPQGAHSLPEEPDR